MKLWVFIQCPRCGFSGCTAPVNESPCPTCGYRDHGAAAPDDPATVEAPQDDRPAPS